METSRFIKFGTTSQGDGSSSTPIVVFAKLSQIFDVHRGVVKHTQTPFTDCVIKLSKNAAVVSVNGKDFSLNLVSVFSLLVSFIEMNS